ncbi:MAG TPA: hypothetical protein DD490_27830 [Acidobacteria bacterium]|nr:hypothetical protein [Acidobacteriota bacterium]
MSTNDPEWNGLMEAWQEETAAEATPAALSEEARRRIRSRVRRETAGLFALAIGEAVMALGLLAWLLLDALDLRRPADAAVLAGIVILFAVTFYYSFWNRRGTWRPVAESTTTFVDLSIERCRRKLRTLPFCYRLLGAELALLVPWAVHSLLSRPEAPPLAKWLQLLGMIVLIPACVLLWATWYKRKTLREMAEWEELRRSLE